MLEKKGVKGSPAQITEINERVKALETKDTDKEVAEIKENVSDLTTLMSNVERRPFWTGCSSALKCARAATGSTKMPACRKQPACSAFAKTAIPAKTIRYRRSSATASA